MATKNTTAAKKTNSKVAVKAPAKKAATAPAKKAPAKVPAKPPTKAAAKLATKAMQKAVVPATNRAPRTAKADTTATFFATFTPGASDSVPVSPPQVTTPATTPKARAPRENSAQASVIAMLKAPEGATLDAIMKATNWQAHTVRGFISGTAKKKLGLAVESTRVEGQRVYRIAA